MRSRAMLLTAAISPPFLALAAVVHMFAVNVPFADSLSFTRLLEAVFVLHNASWTTFFTPIAEHIIAVPLLLMVAMAAFTHWNILAEFWMTVALALCNALLVIHLVLGTAKNMSTREATTLAFVICALIASLTQWESWSFSIMFIGFCAQTAFLAAVVLLSGTRKDGWKIAVAALCCVIASFSSPEGMLSWPATMPLVWPRTGNGDRRRWWLPALWLLCFAGTLALQHQAIAYIGNVPHEYGYVLHHPFRTLRNFFTIMGAPLLPAYDLMPFTTLIGIALVLTGVGASAHMLRRDRAQRENMHPWMCVLLYALGACALLAIGRSYAQLSAYVSRYFSVTQYVAIATLCLSCVAWPQARKITLTLAFVAACGVTIFGIGFLAPWRARSILQAQGKACLETYTLSSSTCLSKLYPWEIPSKNFAFLMARKLEGLGYLHVKSLPKDAHFATSPTPEGGVEGMRPTARTPDMLVESGSMTIRGWAAHREEIWLTEGIEHRPLAHTIAVIPHAPVNGIPAEGWSIEVQPTPDAPVRVEAWAEESTTHQLLRLDGTVTLQPATR